MWMNNSQNAGERGADETAALSWWITLYEELKL